MKKINSVLKEKTILNNGVEMPVFGLGTYKLKRYQAVKFALKNGYRLLDTAQFYGNHKMIAQAIRESGIPRQEVFLVSKIWPIKFPWAFNLKNSSNSAYAEIQKILKELQTDYLDLCLIHWPTWNNLELYRALEKAYREGKIRAIGVSNFTISHLKELLKNCKIPPAVNQVELHPGFRQSQLLNYCQKKNIMVMSYHPLMGGNLTKYKNLRKLAKKYQVSPAQICLRYAYQKKVIFIPKSQNPGRIIANSQINSFNLTKKDLKLIDTIPEKSQFFHPEIFFKIRRLLFWIGGIILLLVLLYLFSLFKN